jgi:hypothetical protein
VRAHANAALLSLEQRDTQPDRQVWNCRWRGCQRLEEDEGSSPLCFLDDEADLAEFLHLFRPLFIAVAGPNDASPNKGGSRAYIYLHRPLLDYGFKPILVIFSCSSFTLQLERADDLGLPPRTLLVRRDYFSPAEKEIYLSLFSDAKRQFSTYLDAGTLLNNCSSLPPLLFRVLLRRRLG